MFWEESGASLLPVTRRTSAPRGHTPVIGHRFKWKRASMAAALCYGSRGGGAQLAFYHQVGAYDTQTLIGALGQLRRALGGQKATLLWASLKGVELANLAADTLQKVIAAAERGIHRIRHTHHLHLSFLRRCGLSLW